MGRTNPYTRSLEASKGVALQQGTSIWVGSLISPSTVDPSRPVLGNLTWSSTVDPFSVQD